MSEEIRELFGRLAEPFDPDELKFKPQTVKGDRAMAITYVDARVVEDRLDEVLGPENWQDDYECLDGGSVLCRLKIRVGGEWLVKVDVGSPSEQPDPGDRMKAAFSDALKRAAVKFGVGRYIYRLPQFWCDYDPAKKRIVILPQLPSWALPAKKGGPPGQGRVEGSSAPPAPAAPKTPPAKKPDPKTGPELVARLTEIEAGMVAAGLCQAGDLWSYVEAAATANAEHDDIPADVADWGGELVGRGLAWAKTFYAQAKKQSA